MTLIVRTSILFPLTFCSIGAENGSGTSRGIEDTLVPSWLYCNASVLRKEL